MADSFIYDGTFELDLLKADETVGSAGDQSGACVVQSPDGVTRINVGDTVRRQHGRLQTVTPERER